MVWKCELPGYNTEEDNAIRISESVIAEEMLELLYNNKKL